MKRPFLGRTLLFGNNEVNFICFESILATLNDYDMLTLSMAVTQFESTERVTISERLKSSHENV